MIKSALILALLAGADDWPRWGRDNSRNMASASEKGLPDDWNPGSVKSGTEEIDLATTKNVKWVVKVGSQCYGNPTVSGGKVFLGTNNESPRDPKFPKAEDRSVVMCFDEKTGEFLWQLAIPKLGTGKVSDWAQLGICSSPAVEGDRVWLTTNRCEVACLGADGLAKGNRGPFQDEAKYLAGPNKPPVPLGSKDGDIIWRFDMREELGVFPHNCTAGAILVFGDKVAATTSNGVDWTHTTTPNPNAPALVLLDKNTGRYLGEEASGISSRTLHGNWSSAAYGTVDGRGMIIFGGGDGWCYAFDPEPQASSDDRKILKEIWRFDCNPPQYRVKDGKPVKYATYYGPSEVLGTPVFYKNRVYAAIGQDPEHENGIGNLVCIDASKSGDITASGRVWSYDKIMRSMSTPSIYEGMLFLPDFDGHLHCLDAETGRVYWVHDFQSQIWGSTLAADGKVYLGTVDGYVAVVAADKTFREIRRIPMGAPVYATPVAANGTLYVATATHLYALAR